MDTLLKTSIFKRIQEFCDREELILPGQTIIIGLSGGPDSVFLLHFFLHIQKEYNLTLVAAHMDHGWRTESVKDAAFCKNISAEHNVTYVQEYLPTFADKPSGSLEQDARDARRKFFKQVALTYNADAIALAHHQDDVAETFFIRLVRGSGLTGLTSIRPRNKNYIRPLLCITKNEILEYLTTKNITYCTDSTNQDTDFLRNAIRHHLMPVYTRLDNRATHNLMRTIEQLQQADCYLEAFTKKQYTHVVKDDWLDIENFLLLDGVVQHRLLLQWIISAKVAFTPTENFFAEITRFLAQPGSKTHAVAPNWAIQKIKRQARIIH